MKSIVIEPNKHFIGRRWELQQLATIANDNEPAIIVVYGRRRVGKTELLEQFFRERNLIKFEGIEGLDKKAQQEHVLRQLAKYTENPLLAKIKVDSWAEIFEIIAKYLQSGKWTLYFEELQWLANYENDFIAELKYVWDNYLRHNKQLLVILCGSAPSFMINQVVKSRSLYNRSQYEIALQEFNLLETKEFLGKKRSHREILDAYLTVGGIPEYLARINKESSILLGICNNAFVKDSFLAHEYSRIFISSLAKNVNYQKIIEYLSKKRFATRDDILKHLRLHSGGGITELVKDLEVCGFIDRYAPYNLNDDSKLARYCIKDSYLQYYFKFIKPIAKKIQHGDFNEQPMHALNSESYLKWLGYAFERFCRINNVLFAKILGFSAVKYQAGAFFNRATNLEDAGFQIDLIYDRADGVYTVCEIKYLQSEVSTKVIDEFEQKLTLFRDTKKRSLQKVLIAPAGAKQSLKDRGYFDRIITAEDIFADRYWF